MTKQTFEINMPDRQKKIVLLFIFAGAISMFFLLGGQQWLSLETIQRNRVQLLAYTAQNYWMVFFAMAAVYTLSTALSLPGGALLSLLSGFLFGRLTGTILIVFSATLGATIIFLLARYLVADWARHKLTQNARAAKLINSFDADAFSYMLFLRLVPLFPFWLVNLAPAFTPINSRTYILSTLIGIIPGSLVFANLGQSLGEIDSLNQLVSPQVLIAFTLLGLLSLLPMVLKHFMPNDTGN